MCDNRSCHATTNAQYNKNTQEVICLECHQPISNISEAMKRVLSSSGQVVREPKSAFTMACKSCNANRQVVLNAKDEAVCNICESPIAVSRPMLQALLVTGERIKPKKEDKNVSARKTSGKRKTKTPAGE